jgi:hypothetical protein
MPSLSRRRLLHLGASAGAATLAGCSFFNRGTPDNVSGTVFNSDTVERTVTVTLTATDGTVVVDEQYTLPADEGVEFEQDISGSQYTLQTTSAGTSESVEWEVTSCKSWVEIGLNPDGSIDYGFSVC